MRAGQCLLLIITDNYRYFTDMTVGNERTYLLTSLVTLPRAYLAPHAFIVSHSNFWIFGLGAVLVCLSSCLSVVIVAKLIRLRPLPCTYSQLYLENLDCRSVASMRRSDVLFRPFSSTETDTDVDVDSIHTHSRSVPACASVPRWCAAYIRPAYLRLI